MLKRCQVQVEGWQMEYLKLISEKTELSLSEMVRVILSEGLLHLCFSLCPESAAKIMSQGELEKALAEVFSSKIAREKKRQLASRLIFEARKATEQMDAKVIRKA